MQEFINIDILNKNSIFQIEISIFERRRGVMAISGKEVRYVQKRIRSSEVYVEVAVKKFVTYIDRWCQIYPADFFQYSLRIVPRTASISDSNDLQLWEDSMTTTYPIAAVSVRNDNVWTKSVAIEVAQKLVQEYENVGGWSKVQVRPGKGCAGLYLEL